MITELIITKQKKFLYKKFVKKNYRNCFYKFSSNLNEVIKAV